MVIFGEAITYGDDISTDLLYPGRYTYHLLSNEQMGEHALEDLDPSFARRDVTGHILVAGKNFGCGSAREQAVKCIKQKGITAIVAVSISRIFYRNCINEGLLPIICPDAVVSIKSGDRIDIDVDNGVLRVCGQNYSFAKFPPFVMDILHCGGLIASVRQKIDESKYRRNTHATGGY